jgi:hypothetical protein
MAGCDPGHLDRLGVGFQAVLLAGSVLHEDYPWTLYLIHAGDAFAKTLAMSVVLCLVDRKVPV